MRPITLKAFRALAVSVLSVVMVSDSAAQVGETQLNENCTISVLNRNVRVRPDGSWVLPNVPANFGYVRARVTCIVDGRTISGESERFLIPPNGVVNRPRITFGETTPIPRAVTVTSAVGRLTALGDSAQLTVSALYADGSTKDVTAGAGTQYTISNTAIATVSDEGLVRAVASGTVVVQATLEGASGMTSILVAPPGIDTDGDGMPDEYETANGLNPANRIDAQEDPDHDGLSNLQEYQLGTNPQSADADGDGLSDGQEVARGTSPLLWDTDGDSVSDGLEVQTGTNPLDRTSVNVGAALSSIRVAPATFVMTFNTIEGEASVRLIVTGTMLDGRTLDITSRGVNFASNDLAVCNFGATEGQVFAGQSGSCTITATFAAFSASATGTVNTFAPAALSFVSIPGFANSVDVGGDFAFVAAGASGLQIVDVTNRRVPVVAASLGLPGNANDVKLDGTRAYVAAGSAGLHIVDIGDPRSPRLLGSVDTPGIAHDVRASGNLAFVADGANGLQVIDVSSPDRPRIIGSVAVGGVAHGVDVSGLRAVVAAGFAGLKVIDLTNPAAPSIVGSVALTDDAKDVVLNGSIAYVANYQASLRVVDISNPASPRVVGFTSQTLGGMLMDVASAPPFVFGADVFFVNGVPIVDATIPATPIARAILDFRAFRDDDGTGIAVDGSFVYMTASRGIIENGTSGDTRLYIGQYRALEDLKGVAPTVTLTAPADAATFIEGETIAFTATAHDDVGVAAVSFLIDGAVVFTDTAAPYQFSMTAPAGAATLTVSVTAIDPGSNIGVSGDVRINVIPDPLTTVVGRVVGRDLAPLGGVTVAVLGRTATTALDGTFSIAGVPTLQPVVIVAASLTTPDAILSGNSAALQPVRGGTTDVGDIIAAMTAFETELGTLMARCDNCNLTVPLPFPFTIAGMTYNRIHVNNGYLRTDGGDFLEAFCCDLTTTDGVAGAGVYVNDSLPGRFVVTWYRHFTYDTGTELNTIQIVLFPDGRIQYAYHGVSPRAYAFVGLYPRTRVRSTRVDLSAITSLTVAADETVYQNFSPTGDRFDLDGGFLIFTPNTGGGYELHPIPDVAAPVCTITNPLDGATLFEGEALSMNSTASDANGSVTRVLLTSTAGGLNADLSIAPYTAPFVVPVGVTQVTFTATAYDNWRNAGVCTSTVNVVPGPPPAVAIVSPLAGAALTAGSTISVAVDAANRVPVSSVDLLVNGVVLATDNTAPFELLFTVPGGVDSLTLTAFARNTVGKTATSTPVNVPVVADQLTTLQGTVVDGVNDNAPVSGAVVAPSVHGALAEVFNFEEPLTALPDLSAAAPNRTVLVSALNLRNPAALFGSDPFGLVSSPSRAIRFSANLRITVPGLYTFTLAVAEGGRLVVNGTTVVDIPKGADRFREGSGSITLPGGWVPIQVLTFDNSTPEVQLSYAIAGGAAGVVPPAVLVPASVPFATTSGDDGAFSIPGVPTNLGPLGASAVASLNGKLVRGVSGSVTPVPGATTDAGMVRLRAFDTLYGSSFSGPTGPATLYQIDPETGAATIIGPIGFWRVGAMDTTEDGTLYAIGRNPTTRKNVLLTIDRTTGAGTEIGPTGVESLGFGDTISDISFRPSDGVLFGYLEAGDGLGTINLGTGAVTALGDTNVSCCGNGLAFAPDGRLLHINENELHLMNQTTGVATVIVPMTYPEPDEFPRISAMDFHPDTGELFGTLKSDVGTFLVRIDIVTGVVTIVGNATVNGLDAVTWGPSR
jgi:hypothetical protein